MQKYTEKRQGEFKEAWCNMCGKPFLVNHGTVEEGVCTVEVEFGYFSRKDGETHTFDLCEDCYDELIRKFRVPVEIKERQEFL